MRTFAFQNLKKKNQTPECNSRNEHSYGAFVNISYPPTWRFSMRSKLLIGGLLASVMIIPALAQSNPPAPAANPPASTVTTTAPRAQSGLWRSSKLIGVNVYNDKNEKLGDINEILLDKSGKVEGVVIGVGGFLGMGEHDIKVEMSKLKFVDEPVRTSSTTTTTTTTGEANR